MSPVLAEAATDLHVSTAAAVLVARSGVAGYHPAPAVRERGVLRDPAVGSWLGSELFANAAWAGTLVYAGAFLVPHEPQRLLVLLAAALAVADLAFLAADCGTTMRTILFSAATFAAGSRTLVSSA